MRKYNREKPVNPQAAQQNTDVMSKLRILDLINTDKSAKELLDHRIAQINKTEGYENAIYCGNGEYVERLRAKGHTIYVIETPRGMSPLALMMSIWKTYRLLRKQKFDIIHTHGSVIGIIGRAAALLARTPKVVHQVHGFHHHDAMNPVQKWIFVQIERLFALITDKLLFQNQADVEECICRRIAPQEKLVLIGNGIQLENFIKNDEPNNELKVILYVARFEPVKNHFMLLKAAQILKERNISFVFQLAGEGELEPTYRTWVREHGLKNVVHFLGYRDDIPSLTAKADVCVLVSIKEGQPRAIIEAAAAGRPMIATDVVGNRDTLTDGTTGFLVPLDDATALADKIEWLLSDAELRALVGLQARKYALKHFDERVVIDKIIDVYNKITENLQ